MTVYKFTQLTDLGEGDRYCEKTHKRKRQYLGKECRIVSETEPYAMQFRDGAVWALYSEQFITAEQASQEPWNGVKYEQVICIEDEEVYDNPLEASIAVGRSAKAIRNSCKFGSEVNGKHYKYL